MSVQIIRRDGKPEWAVVPYETYLQLVEQAETLVDLREYDRVKASLEKGEEELVPVEVVDALLQGENPIKVWREHRGISQAELASAVGISVPYLSQLEGGKRTGTIEVLNSIARALNLSLDDLVPS